MVLLRELPLPKFLQVVAGASLLSLVGGMLNGLAIAGIWCLGLTHLTGTTTNAAIATIDKNRFVDHSAIFYWGLIFFYCVGSFIAGLLVGGTRKKWRGKQAAALTVEAVCVWVSYIIVLQTGNPDIPCLSTTEKGINSPAAYFISAALIAMASGLQNGVTSNLELFVLRTANVTGTVVDIGLGLGQCFREGFKKHRWKLMIWVPVLFFFWVGGIFGGLAWEHNGYHSLVIPAVLISLGAFFSWLRAVRVHIQRNRDRKLKRLVARELAKTLENDGAATVESESEQHIELHSIPMDPALPNIQSKEYQHLMEEED